MLIFAPSKSNVGHEAAAPFNMKAAYFMPVQKSIAATASGSGNTPEASRNLVWP